MSKRGEIRPSGGGQAADDGAGSLLPALNGELELEGMRVAALTLFFLGLLQAGLPQQQRRVTLLVRPNELVPAATRVSVSDCDSLACLARQVKQQLGLDGPEHGLERESCCANVLTGRTA